MYSPPYRTDSTAHKPGCGPAVFTLLTSSITRAETRPPHAVCPCLPQHAETNMYRTCCFALYYPLTSLRKKHQRGVMDSLGPWNIIWTLMWKFWCCSQKNLSCINVALRLFDRSDRESHWSSLCLAAVQETSCILTFNLSDLCCFFFQSRKKSQLCLDRTSLWRVELQTTTQSQL